MPHEGMSWVHPFLPALSPARSYIRVLSASWGRGPPFLLQGPAAPTGPCCGVPAGLGEPERFRSLIWRERVKIFPRGILRSAARDDGAPWRQVGSPYALGLAGQAGGVGLAATCWKERCFQGQEPGREALSRPARAMLPPRKRGRARRALSQGHAAHNAWTWGRIAGDLALHRTEESETGGGVRELVLSHDPQPKIGSCHPSTQEAKAGGWMQI
ncbi:uncharacterized protein LOC110350931 [Heterocephalus glaber]|uniref:Uncharacterized protein LOC110350931 n=1 Tax=Heterocephalus glaber TaxID=10181 RepID=A0AAX6TFP5_HETGA|nr:uncharacterized protein LOC110350931 [Heterocephalus glaber]